MDTAEVRAARFAKLGISVHANDNRCTEPLLILSERKWMQKCAEK
jgi:hypothetical protein